VICPVITQLILLFANHDGKINWWLCQSSIIFCVSAESVGGVGVGVGVGVGSILQISSVLIIQPNSSRAFITLEGFNAIRPHVPLGFLT
tara:strand:- start:688 stop:954 length:267 start_codon:yes stop_codon:yes gene_type:complete